MRHPTNTTCWYSPHSFALLRSAVERDMTTELDNSKEWELYQQVKGINYHSSESYCMISSPLAP